MNAPEDNMDTAAAVLELIPQGEELLARFEDIGLAVDCAYDALYG